MSTGHVVQIAYNHIFIVSQWFAPLGMFVYIELVFLHVKRLSLRAISGQ